VHGFTNPGQFAQVTVPGFYLRRPISVCDFAEDSFSVAVKPVGEGTRALIGVRAGEILDMLTGLGNGFDLSQGAHPLLVGGGTGIAPLVGLARALRSSARPVTALLGFGREDQVCFEEELRALGCEVFISTIEPGKHVTGQVTDLLGLAKDCDFLCSCGPLPMMKAVHEKSGLPGQYSLESRMGCGFGACMGCSCHTVSGSGRICLDGPVFRGEEIVWN